jgi:hypothetical protein
VEILLESLQIVVPLAGMPNRSSLARAMLLHLVVRFGDVPNTGLGE